MSLALCVSHRTSSWGCKLYCQWPSICLQVSAWYLYKMQAFDKKHELLPINHINGLVIKVFASIHCCSIEFCMLKTNACSTWGTKVTKVLAICCPTYQRDARCQLQINGFSLCRCFGYTTDKQIIVCRRCTDIFFNFPRKSVFWVALKKQISFNWRTSFL